MSLSTSFSSASKLSALPGMKWLSPPVNHIPTPEDLNGFLVSQRLALRAAKEIARLVQPGWTEIKTADLLLTYLHDHGVKAFFHRPYAWFGERSRFDGIGSYGAFRPTKRVLQENEVFILDVAPIVKGYACDIGYTSCTGTNPDYEKAVKFLDDLYEVLPTWFLEAKSGRVIWTRVDEHIKAAGYESIHKRYPFAVIGHRLHKGLMEFPHPTFLNFGWQSFWSLLSRGLFGQLLSEWHEGDLTGMWAVEPHIGASGFGAKFEEILVVEPGRAYWLEKG